MTAGTSALDEHLRSPLPARCVGWVRDRPQLLHHLVAGAAMLACVLADRRPVAALVVVAGLVAVSVGCGRRARGGGSAHELVLDLGVMAVCMLAMVPWTPQVPDAGPAMSMSPAAMAAQGHGGATVAGIVVTLAAAVWAVARVRSLVTRSGPRATAILGAAGCAACLAWMLR